MTIHTRGLFEAILTQTLGKDLGDLPPELHADCTNLAPAEAPDRIAQHLARVLERAIAHVDEKTRATTGIDIARRILALTSEHLNLGTALDGDLPDPEAKLLRAITGTKPDGSPQTIEQPLTPLLDTTLLTNAPGEPRIGRQIESEINSADQIDLVMAFIRRSGIRPILSALRDHCEAKRPLRILTTTYTNSTELSALQQLQDLGAEIRISYDNTNTRLHAKAWLFHRASGFSTAFIGSSNLTYSAQVTGLEWNIRASAARNPVVVDKVAAVFESYWHSGDFVTFDATQFEEMTRQEQRMSITTLSPIELRLEPFQERLLEQIAVARGLGQHRNLLAAATGTGKTVMAAADYARLRQDPKHKLERARLLFVAHRKELLDQAQATFRHALRDPAFGELWVGGHRPQRFEHVFASIQSLVAAELGNLDPDHFDVVIVDEFHHAEAPTYQKLLDHIKPRELLGLTATPERSDGLDVLRHFGGRITAELRLWDAIDQRRLAPFAYYGIHDGLDLQDVPWKRGRGYDSLALTNVMTSDDVWARQVVKSLEDHVDDISKIRALGFCVSVDHARFMENTFQACGIAATAVWGDSPAAERQGALDNLRDGKIQVLFSVDLFNEGIDVPDVDTLLMLRPTESPTLFLQQLGRGLRRSPRKTACTVLDFVGIHRKEFRFDRKLLALLGGTRSALKRSVGDGFPYLPAGCHMQLDAIASEIVLRSLKNAIPSLWKSKCDELRRLHREIEDPTLAQFLEETGLELEDVYSNTRGWADLRADAGIGEATRDKAETALRRGVGRLLHVDDSERIRAYAEALAGHGPRDLGLMSERERRLVRMLIAQLGDQIFKGISLEDAYRQVMSYPEVCRDVRDLLDVLRQRITHLHQPMASHADVPLSVHGRYTRLEILAAFGDGEGAKIAAWQTGVRYLRQAKTDLLAFTLDKTSGSFSPTTRYRDYAISTELIHWESQGITREDGETGLRYQQHAAMGSHICLFARDNTQNRAFYFLGTASYVEHRGEKPMAITWKLDVPLPGDLFVQFAAAVA